MDLLSRFALLVTLSVWDAYLTVAEAAHVHATPADIEGNGFMAWILLHWGIVGMLGVKLVPLGLLGVLLAVRPRPYMARVVLGLIVVFAALMVWHGAVLATWI